MSSRAAPLTQEQTRLLDALLSHEFPGAEALRVQAHGLLAKPGCACGCGSIDLFPQGENLPRSSAESLVEVSGHVFDTGRERIGGVLLWVTDGLLSSLEMYWYDSPFPTPALEQIEWQTNLPDRPPEDTSSHHKTNEATVMSFDAPRGTRGVSQPAILKPVFNWVNKFMSRRIRKTGEAFGGMPALVLTTIGAKSGIERTTPVAYFPDGQGNWLIVASYAGAANNPAWYHNIAAHPDQVRINIDGRTENVIAEELHGAERESVWQQITAESQRFADYQEKTDRRLPIIRLTAQQL